MLRQKIKKQKRLLTAYSSKTDSSVCIPYTKENIEKIDMVQQRAVRWVSSDNSPYSNVSNMISSLGWRSLENSRFDAHLIMFYKAAHGLVAIPVPPYIEQPKRYTHHTHPFLYRQIYTSVCSYNKSFST